MATESRRATDSVAEALRQEPWRFEFFQAVRLLEALAHHRATRDGGPALAPVGHDHAPAKELVRFHSELSRSFPSSAIASVTFDDEPGSSTAEMQLAFIGLTGPLGVLPEHYLDLIQRQMRNRDYALRDFFDLFNHRTVSLFYRTWEKYRPAVDYERARRAGQSDDSFTQVLECLIGMGTASQSGRLPFDEQRLLAYAGHFAHAPRSSWTLKTVVADTFGIAVEVEQFIGRWLPLEPDACSRLPGPDAPEGQFNQLGVDTVLGSQAWDEQGKFRLHLGPMSYARFCRFLPDADDPASDFDALVNLIRMYARVELDFDVRLVLAADQVPPLTLGGSAKGDQPRLGWNTWLGADTAVGDRDEALFEPQPL